MKKKVLLKSAAAVMSLLTLAPCFGNVVFAEKPVRQCNQGKRKRCSTEESFTEEDFTEEIENSKVSKCKKAKRDPKEIVKYLSKNKVSYRKVGKEFGVSAAAVWRCVKKLADSESLSDLREKAMEIINRNKQKNAELDPEAVVDHMYNNPGTYKEAAKLFGVSAGTVWYYVKKLADSESSSDLREKAREIINRNKRIAGQKNKKCEVSEEVVLEYIKRNRASYNQAAKKFGVSVGTIANRINKLKETNTNSQKRKKCEILADYDFLNPEDEISEFLYDRSI